jgi:hypothetical protein
MPTAIPKARIEVYENFAGPKFTANGLDLGGISFQVTFTKSFVAIQ